MNNATWNIDNAHTAIGFAVRHMLVSKVRGRFTSYRAELALDTDDLTLSRANVSIDAGSVETGVGDRDAHLKSADFFDVERHPTLTFASQKVERVDDSRYRVTGELTIKGTTREAVLDVEYGGSTKDPWGNTRLGFTAKTSLNRHDFGLTWNQALETGGFIVGDRVDIEVELEAVKAAAEKAA